MSYFDNMYEIRREQDELNSRTRKVAVAQAQNFFESMVRMLNEGTLSPEVIASYMASISNVTHTTGVEITVDFNANRRVADNKITFKAQ